MKFSLITLLFSVSVASLLLQTAQPTTTCHQFRFEGRVDGATEFSHELGQGLVFRLQPTKGPSGQHWGWVIQVQPRNSADDYSWPVNPPFRSSNSRWLSTGYGESVEQQLGQEHEVFFVLTKAEYEAAAKLANEALDSSNGDAAVTFLSNLPALRPAVLKLKPTKFQTSNEGKSVSWMQFQVGVIVPVNFELASETHAESASCPESPK